MIENEKGFTLVELMIVITIIGILTVVVLGSLNDARVDSLDTKVIAEMDAIGKRASIEHSQSGTYDIVCGTNFVTQSESISNIITSINTLASTSVICNSSSGAYAVSAGLQDAHWCIDSAGTRKEITDPLDEVVPALVCP